MKTRILISKKKLWKNFLGIIMFCLTALFSGSVLQSVNFVSISVIAIYCTGIICVLRGIFKFKKNKLLINDIFYLLFVALLLISSILFPSDFFTNIYKILFFSIAYYIVDRFSAHSIIKVFISFSFVVAICAILGTYLLHNTNILDNLPIVENANGVQYKFALLYNYITIAPDRVNGFFWEPGLLSTCMVYALIFYGCFYIKKIQLREILIILLLTYCCFIAKSSAGYVLGVLSIFTILLRNNTYKKINGIKQIINICVFTILLLLIANFEDILILAGLQDNTYVSKLFISNASESSRVLSVMHNLELWIRNPLFGVGVTQSIESGKYIVADTSTSTFLLANYGVGGLIYSISIFYGIMRQKELNIYMKLTILIIMLSIVNKEPHFGNMFTWIFIFLLLKYDDLKLIYNKT